LIARESDLAGSNETTAEAWAVADVVGKVDELKSSGAARLPAIRRPPRCVRDGDIPSAGLLQPFAV